MADILMKKPAENIEITCNNINLYKELRNTMVIICKTIPNATLLSLYKEVGWPAPNKLDESRFVFKKSASIKNDVIYYRFIPK